MKELSDLDLIRRIQAESCNDSLVELTERYAALCMKLVKQFDHAIKINYEDCGFLTENRELLVYNAAKSFKEEKDVVFSTWLYTSIRYFFLRNLYRKRKRLIPSDDNVLEILESQNSDRDRKEKTLEFSRELMDELKRMKDQRIYRIFKLKYSEQRLKHSEIAEILQTCKSNVSRLHISGIKFLKRKVGK